MEKTAPLPQVHPWQWCGEAGWKFADPLPVDDLLGERPEREWFRMPGGSHRSVSHLAGYAVLGDRRQSHDDGYKNLAETSVATPRPGEGARTMFLGTPRRWWI